MANIIPRFNTVLIKKEGNADPALKPNFFYCSLIFLTQMILFLYTMQTLPFERQNVAYQC